MSYILVGLIGIVILSSFLVGASLVKDSALIGWTGGLLLLLACICLGSL